MGARCGQVTSASGWWIHYRGQDGLLGRTAGCQTWKSWNPPPLAAPLLGARPSAPRQSVARETPLAHALASLAVQASGRFQGRGDVASRTEAGRGGAGQGVVSECACVLNGLPEVSHGVSPPSHAAETAQIF